MHAKVVLLCSEDPARYDLPYSTGDVHHVQRASKPRKIPGAPDSYPLSVYVSSNDCFSRKTNTMFFCKAQEVDDFRIVTYKKTVLFFSLSLL